MANRPSPPPVSTWIALWERFGSLPLEIITAPAIGHARDGFLVTPTIAGLWERGDLADLDGAQIVLKTADGYVAGSDPRKDGQALAR